MDINPTIKILSEELKSLGKEFRENELAYLSLTSKNEHIIRDRLAFRLSQVLDNSIVAREYSYIDIAILDKYNKNITDIIELKSMYTFDTYSSYLKTIITAINDDFDKREKYLTEETNQHAILIATHPNEIPSGEYENIIKYYAGIKKHLEGKDDHTIMIDDLNSSLNFAFPKEQYQVEMHKLEAGEVFGIKADICIWLITNLK